MNYEGAFEDLELMLNQVAHQAGKAGRQQEQHVLRMVTDLVETMKNTYQNPQERWEKTKVGLWTLRFMSGNYWVQGMLHRGVRRISGWVVLEHVMELVDAVETRNEPVVAEVLHTEPVEGSLGSRR